MNVVDAPLISSISTDEHDPIAGDETVAGNRTDADAAPPKDDLETDPPEDDPVSAGDSVVVEPDELRFLYEMFSAAEVHGDEVRNVAQLLDAISAVDPESGKLALDQAGRALIRQVLAGIFGGKVQISGSRAQAAVSLDQKFRGEPASAKV